MGCSGKVEERKCAAGESINSLTCCEAAIQGLWLIITVNSDVLGSSCPELSGQ